MFYTKAYSPDRGIYELSNSSKFDSSLCTYFDTFDEALDYLEGVKLNEYEFIQYVEEPYHQKPDYDGHINIFLQCIERHDQYYWGVAIYFDSVLLDCWYGAQARTANTPYPFAYHAEMQPLSFIADVIESSRYGAGRKYNVFSGTQDSAMFRFDAYNEKLSKRERKILFKLEEFVEQGVLNQYLLPCAQAPTDLASELATYAHNKQEKRLCQYMGNLNDLPIAHDFDDAI